MKTTTAGFGGYRCKLWIDESSPADSTYFKDRRTRRLSVTRGHERHAGGDQERADPACGADIFAQIESRQERGQRIRRRGERQREAEVGTLQGAACTARRGRPAVTGPPRPRRCVRRPSFGRANLRAAGRLVSSL